MRFSSASGHTPQSINKLNTSSPDWAFEFAKPGRVLLDGRVRHAGGRDVEMKELRIKTHNRAMNIACAIIRTRSDMKHRPAPRSRLQSRIASCDVGVLRDWSAQPELNPLIALE